MVSVHVCFFFRSPSQITLSPISAPSCILRDAVSLECSYNVSQIFCWWLQLHLHTTYCHGNFFFCVSLRQKIGRPGIISNDWNSSQLVRFYDPIICTSFCTYTDFRNLPVSGEIVFTALFLVKSFLLPYGIQIYHESSTNSRNRSCLNFAVSVVNFARFGVLLIVWTSQKVWVFVFVNSPDRSTDGGVFSAETALVYVLSWL